MISVSTVHPPRQHILGIFYFFNQGIPIEALTFLNLSLSLYIYIYIYTERERERERVREREKKTI